MGLGNGITLLALICRLDVRHVTKRYSVMRNLEAMPYRHVLKSSLRYGSYLPNVKRPWCFSSVNGRIAYYGIMDSSEERYGVIVGLPRSPVA